MVEIPAQRTHGHLIETEMYAHIKRKCTLCTHFLSLTSCIIEVIDFSTTKSLKTSPNIDWNLAKGTSVVSDAIKHYFEFTYILLAFSGVSNSKYRLSTCSNFFSSNSYKQIETIRIKSWDLWINLIKMCRTCFMWHV